MARTDCVAIIGGTGIGKTVIDWLDNARFVEMDTPFGKPSGAIAVGKFGGQSVAFLNRHGDGHCLPPSCIPYAANIFALKQLGARAIIATGAVGSLNEAIQPEQLAIVDQFIDKTYRRQNSFFDAFGAVHVEFAEPTCCRLRERLAAAAQTAGIKAHPRATYVCMEGPAFSTRAESMMHRAWGGDLIGMTALPEAKLAREAQMCYALVALATDYDCWKPHPAGQNADSLLAEIIRHLNAATDNAARLLKAALAAPLVENGCPCRHSLKHAVWTQPQAIDPRQKEKLAPLFD